MANEFSVQELNSFLDYLRTKGLMTASAIAARKAAVNSILGILSAEEAKDVRSLDLDQVAARFANLKGSGFKPDSLRVYKSRAGSAIADFLAYRKNPMTFRPSKSGQRNSTSSKRDKEEKKPEGKAKLEMPRTDDVVDEEVVFPIPLRPNLVVKLVGIPRDLTKREATRIANVVVALAQDNEK
jgi:site-specific recombinase XerC